MLLAQLVVPDHGLPAHPHHGVERHAPRFAVRGDGRRQQGGLGVVDGGAHVAAAGGGDLLDHARFDIQQDVLFLRKDVERPHHGELHVLKAHGLELEDRRAAEHGGVDVKIRVLCGGGDQGDAPVLDILQQDLLLFFVEILDLVQVQQHAAPVVDAVQIGDDGLDVRGGGRGAVELAYFFVGQPGGDLRHRGLSGAGGTVEDQVRQLAGLQDVAQRLVFADQVPLSDHVVQGLRADPVRKGGRHKTAPSVNCWFDFITSRAGLQGGLSASLQFGVRSAEWSWRTNG